MNYRDRWATNEQGEKFLFTVEMQRELNQAGLPVEPESLSQLGIKSGSSSNEERPAVSNNQHDNRSSSVARKTNRDDTSDQENGDDTQQQETLDFDQPLTIQIDPQTGKYIGRMKWYNAKKGYGFIIRGAGEEIFFHKTGTVGEPTALKDGQWILYDVEETRKGPEATEVEPYDGSPELLE